MPPCKKRKFSQSPSEAADSETAAEKLERASLFLQCLNGAASSEPPSPAVTAAPATPVGDTAPEGFSPVTPINPELQDGAAPPVPLRRLQSPINLDLQDDDSTEDAGSEELEQNEDVNVKKEMPLSPGHEAAPAPGCAPLTPTVHSLDSPAAVRIPSPALQESRSGMRTPTAEQADVDTDGATPPGLTPTATRADRQPEAEQIPAPASLPLTSVELNVNLGEMETEPCMFAHSHHDDLSALQRRTTSQIHIQSFPTQPRMRYLRKTLTVDRCQQN